MTGTFVGMPAFPEAAHEALGNAQLRRNLAHATGTIRAKRQRLVDEVNANCDWEALRLAGAGVKESALVDLDDRHLSALLSADPIEQLLRVRDEIVRELHCLPSASRRRALSTNLRYAVLARLRGRNRGKR